MKILVFAHTPPPHHGQSYMVKLLIEGFGGDRRKTARGGATPPRLSPTPEMECYHVNCRYSQGLDDIGSLRLGKMGLVFRYCFEAIWCRFRYGVRTFYYVPAPGKRSALYRDWIVMLLCRPFFRDFIHHWQAAGLGDWLQVHGSPVERWMTHRLLGKPTLGIALGISTLRDPLWFQSRIAADVANGIPDPCPSFETGILPRRRARRAARNPYLRDEVASENEPGAAGSEPEICRVLFLAHCTRDKGLFDTVEGVLAANERLAARGVALRFQLTVAGAFLEAAEEEEFRSRMALAPEAVRYAGFVHEEAKAELLTSTDVFCFPTYYPAEGLPVTLIEAIAYGLPIVTTLWRAIPEVLPPGYLGFVPPRTPGAVAAALIEAALEDGTTLRAHFLNSFTVESYLRGVREVLEEVGREAEG